MIQKLVKVFYVFHEFKQITSMCSVLEVLQMRKDQYQEVGKIRIQSPQDQERL